MYYLQSRYYDPVVGRFVNSDGYGIIKTIRFVSKNLYTYCDNSPVNRIDFSGMAALVIAGVTLSVGQFAAIVTTLVFICAYVFDPKVRDGINQLIYDVLTMLVNAIGYLVNVISEAVSTSKARRQYKGTEKHHIVAQTDRRATYSRAKITEFFIFTWHPANIVTISKTLHKHLHTNAYFAAVDLCIASTCYSYPSDIWANKRLRLIATLLVIGAILKVASEAI